MRPSACRKDLRASPSGCWEDGATLCRRDDVVSPARPPIDRCSYTRRTYFAFSIPMNQRGEAGIAFAHAAPTDLLMITPEGITVWAGLAFVISLAITNYL